MISKVFRCTGPTAPSTGCPRAQLKFPSNFLVGQVRLVLSVLQPTRQGGKRQIQGRARGPKSCNAGKTEQSCTHSPRIRVQSVAANLILSRDHRDNIKEGRLRVMCLLCLGQGGDTAPLMSTAFQSTLLARSEETITTVDSERCQQD